jgi:hypothetical protein
MYFSMEVLVVADEVLIRMTRDQALVLFDWLMRTGEADQPSGFEDQAEQRALWDLESALESVLIEPLREDYRALVETARERLRDSRA